MAAHTFGLDPIVAEARDRWNRCNDAEEPQRVRTLAAKKFRAGDQWEPAIKQSREGKNGLQGQAAQPPRPCLTIDRLSQPVRHISNQIKSANFSITVVPQGQGADQQTAEIYKGYLRRMQNEARDESPIEWAADGAIEGGFGWLRLRTDYVDPNPDPNSTSIEVFDQEPVLERIANNMAVYCDPSANKPTRSDAQYMFVTEDLPREEFERLYPKAKLDSLDSFASTGDTSGWKDWVGKDAIRIAEYWRVTYTDEKWIALADGSIHQVKDFPKKDEQDPQNAVLAKRVVRRPTVEGYKINACEVLEEMEWLGSRIPLIPILGEELNVDGKVILRGVIEEGMDAQRMTNFMYSGAVENFALLPRTPILAATGAVDAYKEIYQTLNTTNWSWAPWDAFDSDGRPMPPPQLMPRDGTPITAAAELMRISEECVKATTGWSDAALGAEDRRTVSGRAKQSEIQQNDLGSSNYADGVQRALVYIGELVVELLPKITRPGQILHVLGIDDEPDQVMVGQHFMKGQDGQPQAIAPEQAAQMKAGVAQFFDPSKGRYAIAVSVGKKDATKREEGSHALGELIPHLPPEMGAALTPVYIEQLDFEGSHKAAEIARKALPPGLQPQDENGPDPQLMAAQQQIQQLQQALQGKQAEQQAKEAAALQRTQMEGQIKLQEAQMDRQTRLDEAQLDRQTRLDLAQIQANATIASAEVKTGSEDLDRRLKLIELFLTADKERRLDSESKAHEVGLTSMEHAHDHALEAQKHDQALIQGEQAAALAPPPNPNGSGA